MQIECPHCQTVFKLTEEQLQIADGMVRCGLCHEIFNALNNDETPSSEVVQQTQQKPILEQTHPEAATEEIVEEEIAEEAQNTPEIHDEYTAAETHHTSFDEPVKEVEKESLPDDLFDGVQSKLIPDEYRIPELRKTCSIWSDIAWSLAILALAVSLFAEYAWFNRNQLVTRTELTPWVKQLCKIVDCEPLGLRDPKQIEMIARNIYSHPNISEALMISVTMVNHAPFPQPYPDINIDFSDVRGEVIASRIFNPNEYIQLATNIDLLHSGVAIDFHLEIQDPGPLAMTYEFNFL